MDHKGVAGPVPQIALHNALEKEQVRQNMSHRRSDEVLLDEEGIALDDLSHQISPVGPPALDRPTLNSQFQSANNTGQTGWRRHHGDQAGRRDSVDVLALGRLYQKLGKLSIIPRYFFYIAPLGIIIAIPLVIGAVIPSAELGVRPLETELTVGRSSSLVIPLG
jgi:hypothetical protein